MLHVASTRCERREVSSAVTPPRRLPPVPAKSLKPRRRPQRCPSVFSNTKRAKNHASRRVFRPVVTPFSKTPPARVIRRQQLNMRRYRRLTEGHEEKIILATANAVPLSSRRKYVQKPEYWEAAVRAGRKAMKVARQYTMPQRKEVMVEECRDMPRQQSREKA